MEASLRCSSVSTINHQPLGPDATVLPTLTAFNDADGVIGEALQRENTWDTPGMGRAGPGPPRETKPDGFRSRRGCGTTHLLPELELVLPDDIQVDAVGPGSPRPT